MKYTLLISCVVFFIVAGQVIGDGPWVPENVDISPQAPASTDDVTITLSGMWGNSCVPYDSQISIVGNDIYFDVSADLDVICAQVVLPWEQSKTISPLSSGTYRIHTSLNGGPSTLMTGFDVTGPTSTKRILYVDTDATGANDGSSWNNAFSTSYGLQRALGDAENGDDIRVAMGTYKPDITNGIIPPSPFATFQLKEGVTIKGGYAGFGEANPDARDIELYETILSGDLNGDDTEVTEPVDMRYDPSRQDNSRTIVTCNKIDATAILDGFTITAGHNSSNTSGMYNYNSSPTINNCTFKWNMSEGGGGMFNSGNSSPTINNCTFSSNYSLGGGGGIYGDCTVINCIFSGNMTGRHGGGISGSSTFSSTLINCVFIGNIANGYGGGIYGDCTVTNCIFWGNSDSGDENSQIYGDLSLTTYSCIQQGFPGNENGNINVDPLFVDADGPDGIVGTSDDDLRLLPGSPCINAGDNSVVTTTTDIDGNERIVNNYVDMGAYELPGTPMIYFVDDDATETGDGSSWENAYRSLPYALNRASYGYEIRVAQGTYRPNDDMYTVGDIREFTFSLKNRVTVKGGYAGFGESAPDARDIELYETILSGDLFSDDLVVTNPADILSDPGRQSNSYTVVTGIGIDATAVLDGFTITGGYGTGDAGGGMYHYESSPTINNCIFKWNYAVRGGGMCIRLRSSPTVSNCTFENNYADKGGGIEIYKNNASPTLINCIFRGNMSLRLGGGIYCRDSDSTITNCKFTGNSTSGEGGGAYIGYDFATLTNCQFSGNVAVNGGGVYCNYSSSLKVTNCTFNGNSATAEGGGISVVGYPETINCIATNCIFWGNTPGEISALSTDLVINYSIVQGGWLGTGIIDFDPGFVDPNGADGVAGTGDEDLRLSADSLCIDSGDNSVVTVGTDLDGNERMFNNYVDMGAYEFDGVHIIYVDNDGAVGYADPEDPLASDPDENGTAAHPFNTINKGIERAKNGHTVLVRPGLYTGPHPDKQVYFSDKNITLTSENPTDPDIVNNTIIGGGVWLGKGPDCTLTGFKIQHPEYGRILGMGTHATISHCIISGNGPCQGTVISDCDGLITNCLITDNRNSAYCGSFPTVYNCNGLIRNCTIANNSSSMLSSAIGDWTGGSMTLENCIFASNSVLTVILPQISMSGGGTLDISYCNIMGGSYAIESDGPVSWGYGNIDVYPNFVRWGQWDYDAQKLAEGNYHLKSSGWRLSEFDSSWTYDDRTSRCIDAGNPGSPLGGELMSVPRDPGNQFGINKRINMGAYSGTAQASMAPYGWALLGDLNNDGTVDTLDLAGQAQDWLTSAIDRPGDLTRDGIVNMRDLAALAGDWMRIANWANQQ